MKSTHICSWIDLKFMIIAYLAKIETFFWFYIEIWPYWTETTRKQETSKCVHIQYGCVGCCIKPPEFATNQFVLKCNGACYHSAFMWNVHEHHVTHTGPKSIFPRIIGNNNSKTVNAFFRLSQTPPNDHMIVVSVSSSGRLTKRTTQEELCILLVKDQPGAFTTSACRSLSWPFRPVGRELGMLRRTWSASVFLLFTWPCVDVQTVIPAARKEREREREPRAGFSHLLSMLLCVQFQ